MFDKNKNGKKPAKVSQSQSYKERTAATGHPHRFAIYSISLIVLACLVVLAVGFYNSWWGSSNTPNKGPAKTDNDISNGSFRQPVVTQYDKAQAIASNGDVQKGQSILDQQLSQAKTPTEKVQVYQQKMTLALNADNYDKAISLGKQTDSIKKDWNTSHMIYSAYLAEGDRGQAKLWLQETIKRFDKQSPGPSGTKDNLNRELKELDK